MLWLYLDLYNVNGWLAYLFYQNCTVIPEDGIMRSFIIERQPDLSIWDDESASWVMGYSLLVSNTLSFAWPTIIMTRCAVEKRIAQQGYHIMMYSTRRSSSFRISKLVTWVLAVNIYVWAYISRREIEPVAPVSPMSDADIHTNKLECNVGSDSRWTSSF